MDEPIIDVRPGEDYSGALARYIVDMKAFLNTPKRQPQPVRPFFKQQNAFYMQLYLARNRSGLTQAALARKTGLKQTVISRLETGRSNPNLCTLLTVVEALNMTLELLPKSAIIVETPLKVTRNLTTMERTLIIAKPDAVQRGLTGEIIKRLEAKGLKLIGLKMARLDEAMLRTHYAEHLEKSFYQGLEDFMKSSPVVLMAWEGFECVEAVRLLVGATNPRQAVPGSIRGDLAIGAGRNLIHASDSKESGLAEVDNFFDPEELFDYDKSEYLELYEDYERS